MRDLAHLELDELAFQAVAALCINDPRFPCTWTDWEELQARAAGDAARTGWFPAPLLLDPEDFRLWCARVEIVPGIDALRAYAIVCRGRRRLEVRSE